MVPGLLVPFVRSTCRLSHTRRPCTPLSIARCKAREDCSLPCIPPCLWDPLDATPAVQHLPRLHVQRLSGPCAPDRREAFGALEPRILVRTGAAMIVSAVLHLIFAHQCNAPQPNTCSEKHCCTPCGSGCNVECIAVVAFAVQLTLGCNTTEDPACVTCPGGTCGAKRASAPARPCARCSTLPQLDV